VLQRWPGGVRRRAWRWSQGHRVGRLPLPARVVAVAHTGGEERGGPRPAAPPQGIMRTGAGHPGRHPCPRRSLRPDARRGTASDKAGVGAKAWSTQALEVTGHKSGIFLRCGHRWGCGPHLNFGVSVSRRIFTSRLKRCGSLEPHPPCAGSSPYSSHCSNAPSGGVRSQGHPVRGGVEVARR